MTTNKAGLAGFWIGLWLAAISLCVWGIVFINTHHPDMTQENYDWSVWMFWAWATLGPLLLLAVRCWKWILTACLIAVGGHEFGKLDKTTQLVAGVWLGYKVSTPETQETLGNYWNWLTRGAQGAPSISKEDRKVLRLACLAGLAIYCFSIAHLYPKPLLQDHAIQNTVNRPSYSQKGLLIHNGRAVSTQNNG